MNWSGKMRASATATAAPSSKPGPTSSLVGSGNFRTSNGLSEFLGLLHDVPRARVLDLGAVSQATLTFFIERGYRVTTEDVLRGWKEFLADEEEQQRAAPSGTERPSPRALMEKFLRSAMEYPEQSFQGILTWDLLDYFRAELVAPVMDRLFRLLQPGGALLALFHSRSTDRFHRYRIVDSQTVELLPAPTVVVHAHVFQNREILDLFGEFRSSKTVVGRDQVREGLFIK